MEAALNQLARNLENHEDNIATREFIDFTPNEGRDYSVIEVDSFDETWPSQSPSPSQSPWPSQSPSQSPSPTRSPSPVLQPRTNYAFTLNPTTPEATTSSPKTPPPKTPEPAIPRPPLSKETLRALVHYTKGYLANKNELTETLVAFERDQDRLEEKEAELVKKLHKVRKNLAVTRVNRKVAMEDIRMLHDKYKFQVRAIIHRRSKFHKVDFLNHEHVQEIMQETLECHCCCELMKGHIYQCKAGHLICSDCYYEVALCPMCRCAYPEEPIRNILAEQLVVELCRLKVKKTKKTKKAEKD